MGFPAARVGDLTVTGDVITGPGAPLVLIMGQPAALAGDTVSGNACVGAIAMGSTTVLISGRPAARTNDPVTGANPYSGVPVSTTIAPTPAAMVLIGP
jgi:uncharacterized Zn-binding protein involved in type VI secretion